MSNTDLPEIKDSTAGLVTVGWREWILLPELTDIAIKAKVDTGAKTSALHAFYIEPYMIDDKSFVKFLIHPYQNNLDVQRECHAPLVDRREVSDSGGHRENRFVIESNFISGNSVYKTELTLTDRDSMLFRMLLGRNALANRYIVDSSASFLLGGSSKAPPDNLHTAPG